MGRTNASLEELKSYFKTHSKIREQKAHTSKVREKNTVRHSCTKNSAFRCILWVGVVMEDVWLLVRLIRLWLYTLWKETEWLVIILYNMYVFILKLYYFSFKKSKENTYRGHTGSVDQLCWHAFNADLLSTASGDKTVRIWDIRSGKCSSVTNTKGENINITWSPDGKTIAVGNKEDLVTFIDTRTNKIRAEEQFNFEVNIINCINWLRSLFVLFFVYLFFKGERNCLEQQQ